MTSEKFYFKGLNELRAIASLAVLFHHIELYKYRSHIKSLYDGPFRDFIAELGKNGVFLFFTLSGFLITFLLLSEKRNKGKINILNFYVRRILRIWPVYYIIIFFAFFSLPFIVAQLDFLKSESIYYESILHLNENFFALLVLFLLFLPNVALIGFKPLAGASQSWSVGVEEQFYLLWPIIIQKSGKFLLLFILFAIAIIYPNLNWIIKYTGFKLQYFFDILIKIFPIHFMAMGGIGAYLYFYHHFSIYKLISSKWMLVTVFLVVILLLLYPGNPIFFGIVCALLILVVIDFLSQLKLVY